MPFETDVLPPRYRDAVRIGHGAMGDIYRAKDTTLDRDVAVKVLAERYAEDAEIRERFTREALTAARLSGEPSIVTIFDVGEWNGRPFIVMEYLPGGSLEQRLRTGPSEVGQALGWLEQAARALDAGHRRGVVHRDVKPGNLLLDRNEQVHVADFGIASATGLQSLTLTGTVLGTAGYIAPEQASGERATPASDRYALAVVAWELLVGERPFANDSPTAEAAAHVNAPVPSLCDHRPDLPCRELDRVFERALAKEPQARYGSCAEFVADLRYAIAAGAAQTEVIRRAAPVPVAARPPRRSPGRWVALGALALGGLLGGIALASALAGGDDDAAPPRPSTRVRSITVTQPGTTVETEVTVTETAPPPPTTEATTGPTTTATAEPGTTAPGTGSISDGRRLTDQATALMRQGRWQEAAVRAEQALTHLRGTGHIYEAYALYNLGRSVIELGDCERGLPLIDQSEAIQGERSEFAAARAKCGEADD